MNRLLSYADNQRIRALAWLDARPLAWGVLLVVALLAVGYLQCSDVIVEVMK